MNLFENLTSKLQPGVIRSDFGIDKVWGRKRREKGEKEGMNISSMFLFYFSPCYINKQKIQTFNFRTNIIIYYNFFSQFEFYYKTTFTNLLNHNSNLL